MADDSEIGSMQSTVLVYAEEALFFRYWLTLSQSWWTLFKGSQRLSRWKATQSIECILFLKLRTTTSHFLFEVLLDAKIVESIQITLMLCSRLQAENQTGSYPLGQVVFISRAGIIFFVRHPKSKYECNGNLSLVQFNVGLCDIREFQGPCRPP